MTQPTAYVLAGHESKVYKLNRGLRFETGFKSIKFQILQALSSMCPSRIKKIVLP